MLVETTQTDDTSVDILEHAHFNNKFKNYLALLRIRFHQQIPLACHNCAKSRYSLELSSLSNE